MRLTPATTKPTEPGWYVVHERFPGAPLVLWWGHASRDWRTGARRIEATHWSGPIPTPKSEPLL